MKKLIALSLLLSSISLNVSAQVPKETTSISQPNKYTTYYGYSYRAFTGFSNPGPVNLQNGNMQLHVLALRYNHNEKWAFRLGTAYLLHDLRFTMAIPRRPVETMDVHVEGFSDLRPSVIHSLYKQDEHNLEVSVGLNLPTAPMLRDPESGEYLPPQDQISSGTYDLMTVLTYAWSKNNFTVSQKFDSVIHTGENKVGYRLGDDFGYTVGTSYAVKPYLIPSFSARFTDRKPLGSNNMAHPEKADKYVGSGWEGTVALRSGLPLGNFRLGFEAGAPVFRTSNTTQYTIGKTQWFAHTNLVATF